MENKNTFELEQEVDRSVPFGYVKREYKRCPYCGSHYFEGEMCEPCHDPELIADTDFDPPEGDWR